MTVALNKKLVGFFLYFAVGFLVVVILAPYLWLFISSISTNKDLTSVPLRWFPS